MNEPLLVPPPSGLSTDLRDPDAISQSIPVDGRSGLSESVGPEDSSVQCRICRSGPGSVASPLIAPCRCRGSLKFVHQACLLQWIQSSSNEANTGQGHALNGFQCEICRAPMEIQMVTKPLIVMFFTWWSTCSLMRLRANGIGTVLFLLAVGCPRAWSLPPRFSASLILGCLGWWFLTGIQMGAMIRQVTKRTRWAILFSPQLDLLVDGICYFDMPPVLLVLSGWVLPTAKSKRAEFDFLVCLNMTLYANARMEAAAQQRPPHRPRCGHPRLPRANT
ncbi:putative E3 ubiquitin-protein ligase MARCH1/8 [Paratrimastix pyriformis]|uniref:E3 ubiquitin-protein ligase MARCH1/8 n=1 Tax=Paratrimastix pyriformis TaxID=342808 RepID=A0ABQ8UQE3_9EUKA|nr:putative E3 ubiquitin-protein ligase MARCH1/8 [Paratrimastix pyriformis]